MAAAIPWIALAVSAGGTAAQAYSSYKANKTAERAATDARNLGQSQMGLAQEMFGKGSPMLERAGSYWGTLLRGNRAAMSQATAGPRAAITDQYRGAMKGLSAAGVRGGARDVALAELTRDRTGRIAGLTSGVQPSAASALSDVGGKFLGVGSDQSGQAGSLFSNLIGPLFKNMGTQSELLGKSGGALGSSLFDLLKYYQGKGGGLASTPFPGSGGYGPMPSVGG